MNTKALDSTLLRAKTSPHLLVDNDIDRALNGFKSHKLEDLRKANLMDRVDVKFMLPMSFLPSLLRLLKSHYTALEIENSKVSRYYNQYFDTADMRFYRDHHNGKLNRLKVRQRTYVDTNTKFLEIKLKNNKNRTIKTRINYMDEITCAAAKNAFVEKAIGHRLDALRLTQTGGYRRIALASEENAERLTLDFDLWYQQSENQDPLALNGFFIAELKQTKHSKNSPFYKVMLANNVRPIAFSKYCIGCALLYHGTLKTNKFKHIISKLKALAPLENITVQ